MILQGNFSDGFTEMEDGEENERMREKEKICRKGTWEGGGGGDDGEESPVDISN